MGPDDAGRNGRMLRVRRMTDADLPTVAATRNHYVRTSTALYTTKELDAAALRARDAGLDAERWPSLVADLAGEVVGYATLRPFDGNLRGYDATAENSLYVAPTHHRRGIGSELLEALLEAGTAAGLRTVIARVDSAMTPSLALHARHGFRMVGTLNRVGHKFGRDLDCVLLQRHLAPAVDVPDEARP